MSFYWLRNVNSEDFARNERIKVKMENIYFLYVIRYFIFLPEGPEHAEQQFYRFDHSILLIFQPNH